MALKSIEFVPHNAKYIDDDVVLKEYKIERNRLAQEFWTEKQTLGEKWRVFPYADIDDADGRFKDSKLTNGDRMRDEYDFRAWQELAQVMEANRARDQR